MKELVLETGEFVTLFFRHDEKYIDKVGEVIVLTKQAESIEMNSEKRLTEEKRIIEELKKRGNAFWENYKISFKEPPYWDAPNFGTFERVISKDDVFVRDPEDKKRLDELRASLIDLLKYKNAQKHVERVTKMNDVEFFDLMTELKKIEGVWKT